MNLYAEGDYRVLVVDDMSENIKIVGTILRENGYKVNIASDGDKALKVVKNDTPDLILLDIIMPGKNGFDVCSQLKKDPLTKDIPVIFLSGLAEIPDKLKGFQVGGVDYITKPVQAEEMLMRIKTHIKIKELYKKLEETNDILEEKVQARTYELSQKNEKLKMEIKHRIQAERALRKSEEDLKITLNSIGDGVVAVDAQKRITGMNPIAEDLTGWSVADARGKLVDDILHLINGKTGLPREGPFKRVLKEATIGQLPEDTILFSKDKREYQIADSCAPIKSPSGLIVGAVMVFRDITEKLIMEDQLRQSQKMESLGQLAGGIAHDFNNLLSGVMGYAESLALKTKDDNKIVSYTNKIIEIAQRAADLTGKLLMFSRKEKVSLQKINLHHMIKEVVGLLERSIDKRISLEMDLKAKSSIVNVDKSLIQNAILNLGLNARDALPEGGNIIISTRNITLGEKLSINCPVVINPGSYIQISVFDDGIGMDNETKKSIFEPFFTTKNVGQGTGLGLSTVLSTIKEHQGGITVFSESGQGTEITLYFPLAEVTEIEEIPTNENIVRGTGCILFIDDESTIRSIVYEHLREFGYNVILASDGIEGLEAYKKNFSKIDLVILDIVMPRMNGMDCLRGIWEVDPNVKVVITTGFSHTQELNDLIEKNQIGFIQKPFNFSMLSRVIHNALKD